jgi:hypothetical protein
VFPEAPARLVAAEEGLTCQISDVMSVVLVAGHDFGLLLGVAVAAEVAKKQNFLPTTRRTTRDVIDWRWLL